MKLALLKTLKILQQELKSKEQEIRKLKEVIELKNKNAERLNDELISGTIENNVLQQKLSDLKKEHSKLACCQMVEKDRKRNRGHEQRNGGRKMIYVIACYKAL